MASMDDLRAAIQDLLARGSFPTSFVLQKNAPDAAYEAYIYTLVLQAIQDLGGTVDLRSVQSPYSQPSTFVFRGSPGYIYSDRADYGYAVCEYEGKQFEVHLDVQHFGNSDVLHEIDISIIERAEGRRCREGTTHPNARKTRGALECKFYGSTLRVGLIRTFVGLTDDMGTLKISRFVSNNSSRSISLYCTGKTTRPRFRDKLTPLEPALERQFVDSVIDDLRKWLG